jgi:hypothetical protein
MTRAAIHLGHHKHPVSDGTCLETLDLMYECIGEQVLRTPNAKNSAIVLGASKIFLADYLIRATPGQNHLRGSPMAQVMDKFETMSDANIRHFVAGTKKFLRQDNGLVDNIMRLKEYNAFKFIHENRFPGQTKGKVFIFKMSVDMPGSGTDLVKRMQPGGDLQDSWIMFDHVRRVKDWSTMACHVYDSRYCRVMTIALCDMQSEDATAQTLFWENLNSVMEDNGHPKPNFKGFMADSAGANWHAVRKVYGNGNVNDKMEGRERTCLFHWTKCLERVTIAHIKPEYQEQMRSLCKQWKDTKTQEEAEDMYNVIRGWWQSGGCVTSDAALRALNDWMVFWHYRYRQWGGAMQLVSN